MTETPVAAPAVATITVTDAELEALMRHHASYLATSYVFPNRIDGAMECAQRIRDLAELRVRCK